MVEVLQQQLAALAAKLDEQNMRWEQLELRRIEHMERQAAREEKMTQAALKDSLREAGHVRLHLHSRPCEEKEATGAEATIRHRDKEASEARDSHTPAAASTAGGRAKGTSGEADLSRESCHRKVLACSVIHLGGLTDQSTCAPSQREKNWALGF
eukprot:g29296.t1